jgi:tRNA modification GTPase
MNSFNDTIAAVATPPGRGGIAVIRISGEGAAAVLKRVFPRLKADFTEQPRHMFYGGIFDGERQIDDGCAVFFAGKNSYTGEDSAEISCHGGIYITGRVLTACLKAGARMAQAGEFTRRALQHGKLNLIGAEAVADIIAANNGEALALAQNAGLIHENVRRIAALILPVSSAVSAFLDYPDETEDLALEPYYESLNDALSALESLISSYGTGKILREGLPAAIIGKPNAGKSTLLNLLLGEERAIVTEIPGTTRDVIEEQLDIGGAVLKIADTAGIRDTADQAEQLGVQRAKSQAQRSSLIIAVFDLSREIQPEDREIVHICAENRNKTAIAVLNKCDLPQKLDDRFISSHFGERTIKISAKAADPAQLSGLLDLIKQAYREQTDSGVTAALANERQLDCALRAQKQVSAAITAVQGGHAPDIIGVLLENALDALYELTGDTANEKIIDDVFNRFCVGK